jgi:DNA-binding NarL/FixJ family response regulator
MSIRTVLVEDVTSFAVALEKYIQVCGSEVRCVAIYGTAEAALEAIPLDPPEVAVVDINLPGMSGIELVAHLKQITPSILCLILTTYEDSNLIFDALKAGACGYLLKRSPADEIVKAIVQVRDGGSPMSPQVARRVLTFLQNQDAHCGLAALSERDREILEQLAQGCMYKRIATQLGISIDAVGSHVRTIYDKLHLRSNGAMRAAM